MKEASIHTTAVALEKWIEMVGISSATAWRWRKRDLFEHEYLRRQYVLPDDHAEFLRRASAGEWSWGYFSLLPRRLRFGFAQEPNGKFAAPFAIGRNQDIGRT